MDRSRRSLTNAVAAVGGTLVVDAPERLEASRSPQVLVVTRGRWRPEDDAADIVVLEHHEISCSAVGDTVSYTRNLDDPSALERTCVATDIDSGTELRWPGGFGPVDADPTVVARSDGGPLTVAGKVGSTLVVCGAVTDDDALGDEALRRWWANQLGGGNPEREQVAYAAASETKPRRHRSTHIPTHRAAQAATPSPPLLGVSDEHLCRQAHKLVAALGSDVIGAGWALRSGLQDPGVAAAYIVEGIPVGLLDDTPSNAVGAHRHRDHTAAWWTLAIASTVGIPVGYAEELGGRLVQDLVPEPSAIDEQRSTSSKVRLAWHTETAFHRRRSRFLILTCLRQGTGADTLLADVAAVRDHLDTATTGILSQPRFRFSGIDPSFGTGGGTPGAPYAILGGSSAAPTIRYDEVLTDGVDDDASAALDELDAAIAAAAIAVRLDEGQTLVLDNARVLHGRSPFTARFDGTDRWLLRSFAAGDDSTWGSDARRRVIDVTYA